VTVASPIVSVAVRAGGVVEVEAVIVTVPLPDPLAPLVMVNHDALLVAVQVHPAAAVTVIDAVPPAAGMETAVCDSAYVHDAPPCVTATVCPAMVSVALRDTVAVLTDAATLTVPLPDPLAPLAIVNHAALLVAVHVQPAPAVTGTAAPWANDVKSSEVVNTV
jgi:hypothetical protein